MQRLSFLIFIIVFVVYGTNLVGGMNSGDQVSYALVRALADRHTTFIDEFRRYTYDTDYSVSPLNQKFASDREPGTALLAIPFYEIGKVLTPIARPPYGETNPSITAESTLQMLTYLSPIFLSALGLSIAFVLLTLQGIPIKSAAMVIFYIAFGSLLWKYSADFSRHSQVAISFLLSLLFFRTFIQENARKKKINFIFYSDNH